MSDPRVLPDAVLQNPACGVCGSETEHGDDCWVCYRCQLVYDPDYLDAAFLDPNAAVCGAACDNHWHKDNAIKPGKGYRCGTCQLPTGHQSMHWTACLPVTLTGQHPHGTEAP